MWSFYFQLTLQQLYDHWPCLWLEEIWENWLYVMIMGRFGECQNCGLASWNASLKHSHIRSMYCYRYLWLACFFIMVLYPFGFHTNSIHICSQLPSPQLESALSKYPNLRGPLAAFTNQSSIKTSVPRYVKLDLQLWRGSQPLCRQAFISLLQLKLYTLLPLSSAYDRDEKINAILCAKGNVKLPVRKSIYLLI